MRWVVTLQANAADIERLLAQASDRLSGTESSREVVLEFEDAAGDVATDESRQSARTMIEAAVRHLNGFGKLRWGRTFDGVKVKGVSHIDSEGRSGQVVFVGTAYAHLSPEEFADMVERMGFPRPDLPVGIEDIDAIDLENVTALADSDPEVARVLRLVELMLEGDDDIDWAAGYSALEIIEQHVLRRGLSGQALGWWTGKEHQRFTQMANSVDAVGIRSRHQGRRFDAPKNRLSAKDASWFVRRVTARWIAWLL